MVKMKTRRRIAAVVLIFLGFFSGAFYQYSKNGDQVEASQLQNEPVEEQKADSEPVINPFPVIANNIPPSQQNQKTDIQKKVLTSTNVDVSTLRKATVKQVIDAGTFTLTTGETVRLIGVDMSNSHDAGNYTKSTLAGKTVYLEKDTLNTDKNGRFLRYAYLENGTFFTEQLIKNGYAHFITGTPNIKYQNILSAAEKYAQENHKGLWAVSTTPEKPAATPAKPSTGKQATPTPKG